jgi:hypothetical protein
MTKQYAVLNPKDGSYQRFDTIDEVVKAAVDVAFAFYLDHTHNMPFADITVNEDGSETWHSLDGTELLSPAQIEAEAQKMAEHMQSFIDAQQLQVTNL